MKTKATARAAVKARLDREPSWEGWYGPDRLKRAGLPEGGAGREVSAGWCRSTDLGSWGNHGYRLPGTVRPVALATFAAPIGMSLEVRRQGQDAGILRASTLRWAGLLTEAQARP
jgi:hypothetical protein